MTAKLHPDAIALPVAPPPPNTPAARQQFSAKVAAKIPSRDEQRKDNRGLENDPLAIRVVAGDIAATVQAAVDRLKDDPDLYAHGGDILCWSPDREEFRKFSEHSDQMRLVVERAGVYMQYSTTKLRWVPFQFTPKEIINPIASAVVEHLPKLVDIEPLKEHRLLSDGEWTACETRYEPQLQRFLALAGSEGPPELPSVEDARAHLSNFFLEEFCFLGEGDHERLKAALAVSALVDFIEGTTVPVFLVTAAREGSGKTELVNTCLELAGHPTEGMSFSTSKAEFIKLLEPEIRKGRRALVYDNVVGHIAHPELERLVTAFGKPANLRELGVSRITATPFRSVVWFTSNGATVTPDLRRRAYSITLTHPNGGVNVPFSKLQERWEKHATWMPFLRLCVLACAQASLQSVPRGRPGYRTWQRLVEGFWGMPAPALGAIKEEVEVLTVARDGEADMKDLEDALRLWPEGEWYSTKQIYSGSEDINTDVPAHMMPVVQAFCRFIDGQTRWAAKDLASKRITLAKRMSKMAAAKYTVDGYQLLAAEGRGRTTVFTVRKV